MSDETEASFDPGTITRLLDQGRDGNDEALAEAWTCLYQELRRVAHNMLRGDALKQHIDATELIGSIWIREQRDDAIPTDRKQFFGRAFRNMARELVERARQRDAAKRGGDWKRHPLEVAEGSLRTLDGWDASKREEAGQLMVHWTELHESFSTAGDVAFCRMVLNLTNAQTASLLELPTKHAQKEWEYARARLKMAMRAS